MPCSVSMVKSVVLLASIAATSGRLVHLKDGPVNGSMTDGVAMWRGIPFAAPPVGDLRWRPPQAPKPWAPEVLHARNFGADCIQAVHSGTLGPILQVGSAEDCLFVNVFAPSKKPASPKPVLLWIYGGGFQGGGGRKYDGKHVVALANGELLFVSFNYRLNVFGFAAGEQLRGRDPEGGTGNYGILDQRSAMQWTQSNIGAFGGDPARVVLVGQSAGGCSVANHLVRRKSWGLFAAAGVDSGPFYSQQRRMPGGHHVGPTPTNVTVAQQDPHFLRLLASAGCKDVDCMLQLNETELLSVMFAASPDQLWPWEPTIDDVDLVDSGPSLAAAGVLAPVPVVVGSNMEDDSQSVPNCEPGACTEADFREMVASWSGFGDKEVEHAVQVYGNEGERAIGEGWDKWYTAERHFGTDSMMTCPSRRFARWVTQAGQNAYWYYWAYMPKLANGTNKPASHGSELSFMFQTETLQPSEAEISKAFSQFWINFTVANTPGWPSYEAGTDAAICFDEDQSVRLVKHMRNLRCDFWDTHLEHWISNVASPVVL